MIFEKIKSQGLAHNSYFIGSQREAAVIDPRRDAWIYAQLANHHDVKITHIFETHRNEDYVIGSYELASITDADIYHGAALDFDYGNAVSEGDIFEIGSLELEILETPGHTPESISITMSDTNVSDDVYMVFTGDALFVGEVGRTDLYGEEHRKEFSETLYESITNKLLTLDDGVIVCPAHGAGSVCGGAIGDYEFTTIGYEKRTNPMLNVSKEEFVNQKLNELLHVPPYFRRMEKYNKDGAPILHRLPDLSALSFQDVDRLLDSDVQIVDIRKPAGFAAGHIPNSLNIWRGGLASYVGWFLNYEDPILLVNDYNLNLESVVRQFIRLGYDNIEGFLAKGITEWFRSGNPVETIEMVHPRELKKDLDDEPLFILDVGKTDRWKKGHIKGAKYRYVGELPKHLADIPKHRPIIVYCESGFKTSVAASYLKQQGYEDVKELIGGWMAWRKLGFPTASST